MSTLTDKQSFLAGKRFAVVGISTGRGFGNSVYRDLTAKGYTMYPVSISATTIEGVQCYKKLSDITEPIDGVITVVPPAATEQIVQECIALGIKKIWMQVGSESKTAIATAQANGITVISDHCIMMYAQPSFPHNFHGWIAKMTGKY